MLRTPYLFQSFTRNIKMSQSWLATLLVVASFLVTSSSIQINMSKILWCGKYCKTSYFVICHPVCSGKWLWQFSNNRFAKKKVIIYHALIKEQNANNAII